MLLDFSENVPDSHGVAACAKARAIAGVLDVAKVATAAIRRDDLRLCRRQGREGRKREGEVHYAGFR